MGFSSGSPDSCYYSSVVEPKLFVSAPAPAPAPTFKKFPVRLRLRLKLFGYLFSQLLNLKVDFSWLFVKNIDIGFTFWSYSIKIKYTTLVWPGAGAGAETSVYRLQLRPKVPAPCGYSSGSGSTTLYYRVQGKETVTDCCVQASDHSMVIATFNPPVL